MAFTDLVAGATASRENPDIANLDPRFDVLAFFEYVYQHKRIILLVSLVAVSLATVASLLLPKSYTATASIMIEPPAGNDPRAATAVSPIYLESLKTYEHFASSDSLFAQALSQLKLRDSFAGTPLESLKRKVLKVVKPRDTKILEIQATLGDPTKAQAFAQYVAEQTVALNQSLGTRSERDLTEHSRKQVEAAALRLEKSERAREAFMSANAIEGLEGAIGNGIKLKFRLQRHLAEAKAELADSLARAQLPSGIRPVDGYDDDAVLRREIAAVKAKVAAIEQEISQLDKAVAANQTSLQSRKMRLDILNAELHSARAQFETYNNKNNDILTSAAFRGERLEIIDRGTVPERPSFPNLPLNIAAALVFSIASCIVYLTMRFSYSRLIQARNRSIYGTRFAE